MDNYIKEIKNRKWIMIFSILFSTMFFLSTKIVFSNGIFSTNEEVYFYNFSIFDIFYYIVLNLISFFLMNLIFEKTKIFEMTTIKKEINKTKLIRFFMCSCVLMLIGWLPYILSYFPGGVYVDTLQSINMARDEAVVTNHHPILYTVMWMFCIKITNLFSTNVETAMELFTVLQTLAMIIVFSIFLLWLYKNGFDKKIILLNFIFFTFFPIIPLYAISLWKDTPFSIFVFLYCLVILDLFYFNNINAKISDIKIDILYFFVSLLVAFGRNNGIYIIIFTSTCIILYLFNVNKSNKKNNIKFSIFAILSILLSLIFQGLIYDKMGYNGDEKIESYGIPIQQIGYIITHDGNLNEEEREFFNQIMNEEEWCREYKPCIVDPIKWNGNFKKDFFDTNTKNFFKNYVKVVLKNPMNAIKGWLLETLGYWDINKTTNDAYINCEMWPGFAFKQHDIFEKIFGFSIRYSINNIFVMKQSIGIWILLFLFFDILNKKNFSLIFPIIPSIVLVATLMLAAPLAFSFRYVFSTWIVIPIGIVSANKKTKNKYIGCG